MLCSHFVDNHVGDATVGLGRVNMSDNGALLVLSRFEVPVVDFKGAKNILTDLFSKLFLILGRVFTRGKEDMFIIAQIDLVLLYDD